MPIPPWRPCSPTFPSKRAQKRHEVLLLLRRQLDAEDEVEELHRVVEAQEPAVVQVRRGGPDSPGRGRPYRAARGSPAGGDDPGPTETPGPPIPPAGVPVGGGRAAGPALC